MEMNNTNNNVKYKILTRSSENRWSFSYLFRNNFRKYLFARTSDTFVRRNWSIFFFLKRIFLMRKKEDSYDFSSAVIRSNIAGIFSAIFFIHSVIAITFIPPINLHFSIDNHHIEITIFFFIYSRNVYPFLFIFIRSREGSCDRLCEISALFLECLSIINQILITKKEFKISDTFQKEGKFSN